VNDPRAEWQDMPEFEQKAQKPFAKITIRVGSQEELDELSALIGQKLTQKTKAIWHPKLVRGVNSSLRYIDEPEASSLHNIEGSLEVAPDS